MNRRSPKIAAEILYHISHVGLAQDWRSQYVSTLKDKICELIRDFDISLSHEDRQQWTIYVDEFLKTDWKLFRRDRHLWAAQIHFVNASAVFSIDCASDRVYICFNDFGSTSSKEVYFWTWTSELEDTRSQVKYWSHHFYEAAKQAFKSRCIFIYRTDRVFDSLFVLARVLYNINTGSLRGFDKLVKFPTSNMFDITTVVPRKFFEKEYVVVNKDLPWESVVPDLQGTDSVIECLPDPAEGQEILSEYFKKIINSIAAEQDTINLPNFAFFVSFEFEKRVWKEQREGVATIIRLVLKHLRSVSLVVNGMTAPLHSTSETAFDTIKQAEEEIIDFLKSTFENELEVIHLHNFTTIQKIKWAKACDFFISPAGSSMLLPGYLGKYGLIYGIKSFVEAQRWYTNPYNKIATLPAESLAAVEEDLALSPLQWSKGTDQGQSYSINVDKFVEAAAPLIVTSIEKYKTNANQVSGQNLTNLHIS